MKFYEIEELAALMLSDNNEEEADRLLDSEDIICLFEEKYNINFDDFASVVKLLVRYTPLIKSPLTDELFNCFGIQEDTGIFRAIIREKFNNLKLGND